MHGSQSKGIRRMSTDLDYIVLEPEGEPTHLIVWLHGLGADGHDFEPVGRMLRFKEGVRVKFIFPHAPMRPITINGGMVMRGWYDILGMELTDREDREGVFTSSQLILDLIKYESEKHGIDMSKVVLIGFSQGGAIALHAALSAPYKFAGAGALSTYIPLAEETIEKRSPSSASLNIFQAHGAMDPLVREEWGRRSHERLVESGLKTSYKIYPMAHQVCDQEIQDLQDWLNEIM